MRTKENIYFHEWIGMNARITDSVNPNEKGINGIVCDESKNTLTIMANNGTKKIVKNGRMFELGTDNRKFIINGNYSGFRPENRIKERRKIEKMLKNGD